MLSIFVLAPAAMLLVRDAVRRPNADDDLATTRKRLAHPDWRALERHLRRPPPASLRSLFEDSDVITGDALARDALAYSDGVQIARFCPIDTRNIEWSARWTGQDIVALALTETGDVIHLRPGATEPDVIYLTHHDGGDTEIVEADVDAFVVRVRRLATRASG